MNTTVARASWPERLALRSAVFAERWFPDAWVFAVIGVLVVAACALGFGATPAATAEAFGGGFWSLIPFTMQMAFVVIGGYVVATAPAIARLIDRLARWPRTGRGAIAFVALVSMLSSLPTTEMSRGTSSPRRRAVVIAPIAITSEPQTTAVTPRSSSVWAAVAPPSIVNTVRSTSSSRSASVRSGSTCRRIAASNPSVRRTTGW